MYLGDSFDKSKLYDNDIRYEKVTERLNISKKDSMDFLKKALEQ